MTLDVNLHIVESKADVDRLYDWMAIPRPYIAVDTETEGLQWWKHRPRLLQVGDANEAWAIPWHLWGGAILEIIREFPGDLIMHNMPFDIMMFEHHSGVKLPRHRIHDTRIQAHILEPHKPTGLKPVAERWVDRQAARSQRILHEAMALHGWGWDTVPVNFQPYWVYACMDCILTSRVHDHHYPIIQRECPNAYQLEMATGHVLIDMMRKGVQVDLPYTNEKLAQLTGYVDQVSQWTEREYGVKAGSDAKIVDILQSQIYAETYKFTKMTESGSRLSLDRQVLEEVIAATHHPLAEAVLSRRRAQRICSAYLSKFSELAVDGRIHPNYNPVRHKGNTEDETSGYGALTGRMSVSDPPLQQLPRKSNDNPMANIVRNCITATSGNTLIMCDFDQVEFRIYAHLTKDPGLLAAFGEGDFFVNIAKEIFQDPNFQKSDPRRQLTKNAAYAKIYGAGPAKFAVTAGIDTATAEAFMQRMDSLYPGMNAFNYTVQNLAEQRDHDDGMAYVYSPLSRRKFINADGRYYALVNYLVQGVAAEVLKMKDLEIHASGLGEYLVLNVHDEVILDVPHDLADQVGKELHGIMQDTNLFTVSLTAGLDTAERWGGASK